MWIYFVASLIGLGAGVLGSMFGLGGGFLIVPLLNIAGVDIRVAVGTSASAIFFNMLSSTIAYSRYKYVVYKAGALLSATAVVTAYFGAQLT
ncbi:MAG: sulfite exporter TauE/SafE family protein, partial [Zestosphaera sp.]